jgi:glycosyltransferase involved in cell wall biosynthesis
MKKTTITIVIPVFNVEKFVNDTLSSVKNQISQADEVIVINDGSTDGSFNIINNFRHLQGWKIIQTHNQGLGLTRNFGRSMANSDYIYFLDSDDIIKNDLILRVRKTIHQYNQPDIILFSGESFNYNGPKNKEINLKFTLPGENLRGHKLITKLLNKKETLPQVSRYITKVELWTKNKLDYPEGIAEDEALFFPLLALSERAVIIPEVYYNYRVGRPGSITLSTPSSKHARDYLNRICSFMEFMNLRHDLIKIDHAAWRYRLGRYGLHYISICLQTKTPIDWSIILVLFFKVNSLSLLFKLLWRILIHHFPNNNLRNK